MSAVVLTTIGTACSNEPGKKETANSAPIIKTEPAKPASDKGVFGRYGR
ncbi:MAG: hypothetical protein LC768_10600 [Acidobacteria bacterium]|nr:hypothetical protein [Acidobacteriota bacterium]MCA1638763.1 hypothetical protein [Acidobacteriota bacterium]